MEHLNLKVELSGSIMTLKVCLPKDDKTKRKPKTISENRVVKIRGGFFAVVTNKNNEPTLKQCNEARRNQVTSVPEGYIEVKLGEPRAKETETGVNEYSWVQDVQRTLFKTLNDTDKREFAKVFPAPAKIGVLDDTKKVQVYTDILVGFREEAHPVYENATIQQFFVKNSNEDIYFVNVPKEYVDETLKSLSNVGIHLVWVKDSSTEGEKFSRKVAALQIKGGLIDWIDKELEEKKSYSALNAEKIEELSQARKKNRYIKAA